MPTLADIAFTQVPGYKVDKNNLIIDSDGGSDNVAQFAKAGNQSKKEMEATID